jgi:hypothetical protein
MYQAVVKVSPNEDFTISVVFEDGISGILDMKPYLDFGVFRRISSSENFERVRISFDTVEWECGVDLDPEFVRAKSELTTPY